MSAPTALSEAELAEIQAQVDAQGAKVRELKAAKADKDAIKEAVDVLLALKAKLPQVPKPEKEKKKKQENKGPSAKELRKMKREADQAAAKAKAEEARNAMLEANKDKFAFLPLNQSRDSTKTDREWTHVKELNPELQEKTVWLRGYMDSFKATAKTNGFLKLRQTCFSTQCVIQNPDMLTFAGMINRESIVDVCGKVVAAEVRGATQTDVEVVVEKLFVVHEASLPPFYPADAARTLDDETPAEAPKEEGSSKKDAKGTKKVVTVDLNTKLDNRFMDLRTPVSQAIFRVTSTVCAAFREILLERDFVEIQTPKLLGGQSEGGAEVFKSTYFGEEMCLAQSPQLHKQIAAACSGFEKVFEIGPVFRAENSNTARHLCEFHGLDLEMAFKEHYHEVLDLFSDCFHHIFKTINARCASELEVVREYTKFEDLVYEAPEGVPTRGTTSRTLYLTYPHAVQMLREAGVTAEEHGDMDDFSTPTEKKLGGLVKEKYGVDFYFLDKYPAAFRPFYTMPDPEREGLSNSYDFFIRGQEILSGAQRVHDTEILIKQIESGVAHGGAGGPSLDSIRFYLDAFKYGAMPHGGGGVGLERVVMLFLGLPNIRMSRMFPRDPNRLVP